MFLGPHGRGLEQGMYALSGGFCFLCVIVARFGGSQAGPGSGPDSMPVDPQGDLLLFVWRPMALQLGAGSCEGGKAEREALTWDSMGQRSVMMRSMLETTYTPGRPRALQTRRVYCRWLRQVLVAR